MRYNRDRVDQVPASPSSVRPLFEPSIGFFLLANALRIPSLRYAIAHAAPTPVSVWP